MIRLDIFADPVCPWCLIGKLELDQALERRPDHPFLIAWYPFRLNPEMPREGMDRQDYLDAKPAATTAAREVVSRAAQMGLNLQLPQRQPDTTDAHRLMHWASIEKVQSRVMAGLLKAFWQEGRDIGDAAELTKIGTAAGMDEAMIVRLLASDSDRDEIERREKHAKERGIRSVPTFIVDDRHVVSGAQSAALWQQVIDELSERPSAG